MSFKGKIVLVTGASSGIGAATAIKLAAEGAKLAIVGRNVNKLNIVAQKCVDSGSKPLSIVADLTKDQDIERIVDETISHYGKLDILVNNAGRGGFCSILDKGVIQLFDQLIATNLRSAVYLTNLAAPHLVETKGNIVNVSSIAGIGVSSPESSIYGASKAGLDHFTRTVALELAGKGVRVNSVNPGPVKTDFFENMGIDKSVEEVLSKKFTKLIPLKRYSESEEIADLILFLASEKAKSITGSIYVIDNGRLLVGQLVKSFDNELYVYNTKK